MVAEHYEHMWLREFGSLDFDDEWDKADERDGAHDEGDAADDDAHSLDPSMPELEDVPVRRHRRAPARRRRRHQRRDEPPAFVRRMLPKSFRS